MNYTIKTLKKFACEAWKGSEVMNISVKKIVKNLLEVLQIEFNALEKRIKDTPYDFLREELASKKPEIVANIEDASSLIERDDILIQIADLENQIANLEKRKEKGESISDLIKKNITTLENLRIKEKTIISKLDDEFGNKFGNNLYSEVLLLPSGEDWVLYDEENTEMLLREYYYKAFGLYQYSDNAPKIFVLSDKDDNAIKIREMIERAIRCESAKVFESLTRGPTTTLIIGAKSIEEATDEVIDQHLTTAYLDGYLYDIVSNPINDIDFWEKNEDLIQELRNKFSSNVVEVK